mgnify:CR=1 FL=1
MIMNKHVRQIKLGIKILKKGCRILTTKIECYSHNSEKLSTEVYLPHNNY